MIWGALWDGRHTQLVWDRGDPKALSQMLAFCISTNLFTWNSVQGGQSCRLWKPTATKPFPGKAPHHETAQSSQLLSNPTKQEENQHFTGGANRSSAKADFPPALICKSPNVGCSTNRPLSFNNKNFKTKQKNLAKAKDFFKLEQIKQTLSKEEFFWYSSWRLFLAQHQRLGL